MQTMQARVGRAPTAVGSTDFQCAGAPPSSCGLS